MFPSFCFPSAFCPSGAEHQRDVSAAAGVLFPSLRHHDGPAGSRLASSKDGETRAHTQRYTTMSGGRTRDSH